MMMQIIECPICLQPVKNTITTHCNHIYCDSCIIDNLMIRNTCPMCRSACNYDQIMNQIKPNREKTLIKKLYKQHAILYSENAILQGQHSVLHSQNQGQNPVLQGQTHILLEENSLTNYDMPMQFVPSFAIMVFVVEVSIIICIIFFIVQKVNHMHNQENK